MNIFHLYDVKIKNILKQCETIAKAEIDERIFDRINIEVPRDASHGDLATNAAMVLANPLNLSPRELAEQIIVKINDDSDVETTTIAGPGFINIKLSKAFWHKQLHTILEAGLEYGKSNIGNSQPINIEYVSANPTGPMHVGHGRGAVVGDVIASILSFVGYDVTREYYINDAGGQIDVLAQSVFMRYKQALGEEINEIPEGLYPGEYLIPLGQKLAETYGQNLLHDANKVDIVKNFAINEMMKLIKEDLLALNVKHDIFFSERELHKNGGTEIETTISELTLKGYVYKGILEAPKSGDTEDWEPREQILFRSTSVGDDRDRALMKSDGSYTYFAADVAYFNNKYKRGYKQMIYVLGADHSGYVKRLEALGKAISGSTDIINVLLCQLIKLLRNGNPVKMSKRAGNFITLRDVIDEVGCDPVRFMMIFRKSDAPLDFDFAKVTEQTKDNPIFYVQYAVARCYSIFKLAKETFTDIDISDIGSIDKHINLIDNLNEFELIKKIATFPQLIKSAAINKEPHRLAFYLYDLASMFHSLWSKGNEDQTLRFVQKDSKDITLAKLALVKAVCNILTIGLNIIKVDAPEAMN